MASATLPDAPAVKRPSGLSPRTVFSAVRRRPLAFVGVFLLAGGAAAAVWFLLPVPKLTAAVGFHLSPPRGVLREGGGGDLQAFKATQAGRVKNRMVLHAALDEPGVRDLQVVRTAEPDPRTWLDRNLKVDTRGGGPDVLRVVLEGDDEEELIKVLAAVSRVYRDKVKDDEIGDRQQRLDKLKNEHDKLQKELDRYHQRMDELALAVGRDTFDYHILDQVLHAEHMRADNDLRVAQGRLEAARDNLAALEAGAKAAPPPAGPQAPGAAALENQIERAVNSDPGVVQLRNALAAAQFGLKKFEEEYHEGAPDLLKARAAIRDLDAKLVEHRAAVRKEIAKQVEDAQRGNAAERRERLDAQVKQEEAQVLKAQRAMTKIESNLKIRRESRSELERLRRESETTQVLAKQMADEKGRLAIELNPLNVVPRVTEIEKPFVVPGLEGNKRLKYALIAAAATFILGFGGLVGWEARSRRVTHTDDVTTDLGVRLLGTVPPTGGANGPGAPPAALAEAIDTARTMLLHGTPGGPAIRTVLVTSGVAGEGKTSLAGHLSISLARAGFRTVLVDGDLQSPSAHRLFDCPVGPGLCELLRDEVGLDDAARPTPVPGLALLPAGRWDTAARQALVGDRWRRLKADLEARYDFVVVDSAPLLLVSDTLLLAREADGVVLSVLLGVSQVSHVAETAGRLQAVGARLTGAVVNGVWHRAYRAGSAYRYAAAAPAAAALGEGGGEDRA
ncbi:MAG: AAA family ATPase [Gemmataceae bacterium]|nr:AAA family ATPase [Gemmataceae bacterium]